MAKTTASPADTRETTDHEEIRQWAEERGGHPATVRGTTEGAPGVLTIRFPDYGDDSNLEDIDWEAWQNKFDEENLKFLYQDKTKDGETSRFFRLAAKE